MVEVYDEEKGEVTNVNDERDVEGDTETEEGEKESERQKD
jgi:hypothetical protein